MSLAARALSPGGEMHWFDHFLYRRLGTIFENLFLKFAAQEVALEKRRMAEEGCKHDMAPPEATFCPGCGKQLGADPEVNSVIERTVRRILSEYDVKPKAKPKAKDGAADGKSLKEKLGIK